MLKALILTTALLPLCNCTTSNVADFALNTAVKSTLASISASFWSRLGMVTFCRAPVTKVKRTPSCSTIIWLLVPKVVGPPAWLVLIVSPVVMLAPLDWSAGSLPVAMIVGSVMRRTPPSLTTVGFAVVNIRNRFWPEGALARLNAKSWLVPMNTLFSRLTASSGLPVFGCFSGWYSTVQILPPLTGDPVSSI
ncbi:hypothetical protein D3C78_697650 [compost metagenome]